MATKNYANAEQTNSLTLDCTSAVASNSLVMASGGLVALSGGFAINATTNSRIEGVSITNKTFDSDNQTVAKDVVSYIRADKRYEFKMPIDGAGVTQADIGKWFNITSDQVVDNSTKTTTKTNNLNLRLVAITSNANYGIFVIDNDLVS